jgi:hypothetical protein
MTSNAGIMGGVLGIAVSEVVLHGPEISALIGQVVAALVAKHVWPNPMPAGTSPDFSATLTTTAFDLSSSRWPSRLSRVMGQSRQGILGRVVASNIPLFFTLSHNPAQLTALRVS